MREIASSCNYFNYTTNAFGNIKVVNCNSYIYVCITMIDFLGKIHYSEQQLRKILTSFYFILQKSRTAITRSGSSSFSELFVWILSPLFTLITLLKAFLLGSPDHSRGAYNPTSSGSQNTSQQSQRSR